MFEGCESPKSNFQLIPNLLFVRNGSLSRDIPGLTVQQRKPCHTLLAYCSVCCFHLKTFYKTNLGPTHHINTILAFLIWVWLFSSAVDKSYLWSLSLESNLLVSIATSMVIAVGLFGWCFSQLLARSTYTAQRSLLIICPLYISDFLNANTVQQIRRLCRPVDADESTTNYWPTGLLAQPILP